MIQYTKQRPIIIGQRGIRLLTPQEKAERARQENERNRTIASNYFNSTPSIGNLARGAYYWVRGNIMDGSEDPEDYRITQLEAPDVYGKFGKQTLGTLKKVLGKTVSEAPNQSYIEGANRLSNLFKRQFSRAAKTNSKEMAERISRAYKVGVQRGTQNAERAAEQSGKIYTKADLKAAKRQGAKTQREWGERTVKNQETSNKQPDQGTRGTFSKVLWETKKNNFGQVLKTGYKTRNTGRGLIYLAAGPTTIGLVSGGVPQYLKYAGKSFAEGFKAGMGNDTIPASPQQISDENKRAEQSDTAVVDRGTTAVSDTLLDQYKQRIQDNF